MNEVLNQIKNRKTIRMFENKPIEDEVKEEIINAAFEAPTAGLMMRYSIIDVTDKELKKKLAIYCDNQHFIEKAPMILIFLADYQRWYDIFSIEDCAPRIPREGDLLVAFTDALIAAQNTVIAAESLDIGSCYIGDILENEEKVRELLNLPDYVVPATMIIYGYPTEDEKNRTKTPRFDGKYMVYKNKYHRITKEDHIKMHEERFQKMGLKDVNITYRTKSYCNRKYMSDFALEMNRSVKAYLDKFRLY
ncbi:nitroreductase family protein [Clostridium sp. SHJSY1]|uniref:nitroreductase family protein n=1 Tax=Clostridium sp. SHJSY1 TaxID=2942483 RepID=UPI0028757D51|nr:nitroreductase family protein [Clostridium sp. SHJSY1]MDS0526720.1 nitroreductase family protein [Clostridium sp. SHJSY1]